MHAQVVEDNDLTRPQRGREHLLDVSFKRQAIGRAGHQDAGPNAGERQGCNHRRIGWSVARHWSKRTLAARCTRIAWRQIQVTATLIENHEVLCRASLEPRL